MDVSDITQPTQSPSTAGQSHDTSGASSAARRSTRPSATASSVAPIAGTCTIPARALPRVRDQPDAGAAGTQRPRSAAAKRSLVRTRHRARAGRDPARGRPRRARRPGLEQRRRQADRSAARPEARRSSPPAVARARRRLRRHPPPRDQHSVRPDEQLPAPARLLGRARDAPRARNQSATVTAAEHAAEAKGATNDRPDRAERLQGHARAAGRRLRDLLGRLQVEVRSGAVAQQAAAEVRQGAS